MTKHTKLMVLAAVAVVISTAPITKAHSANSVPSPEVGTIREWQDENILNNHLRQAAGLPSLAEKSVKAEASPAGEVQFKKWEDETIHNNTMRQRMGLSSPTDKATGAGSPPAGEGQLKQWEDETIYNNTMRQHMGLSPR